MDFVHLLVLVGKISLIPIGVVGFRFLLLLLLLFFWFRFFMCSKGIWLASTLAKEAAWFWNSIAILLFYAFLVSISLDAVSLLFASKKNNVYICTLGCFMKNHDIPAIVRQLLWFQVLWETWTVQHFHCGVTWGRSQRKRRIFWYIMYNIQGLVDCYCIFGEKNRSSKLLGSSMLFISLYVYTNLNLLDSKMWSVLSRRHLRGGVCVIQRSWIWWKIWSWIFRHKAVARIFFSL